MMSTAIAMKVIKVKTPIDSRLSLRKLMPIELHLLILHQESKKQINIKLSYPPSEVNIFNLMLLFGLNCRRIKKMSEQAK